MVKNVSSGTMGHNTGVLAALGVSNDKFHLGGSTPPRPQHILRTGKRLDRETGGPVEGAADRFARHNQSRSTLPA